METAAPKLKAKAGFIPTANYDPASQWKPMVMDPFSSVYILQSDPGEQHFYVGLTDNLPDRLRRHNRGEVTHTASLRPWRIKTAIAFRDRNRAAQLEQYLKTASGRAFAKKQL